MIKLEIAKPVGKLRMLVLGFCCDKAGDSEAGDGEAGDGSILQHLLIICKGFTGAVA